MNSHLFLLRFRPSPLCFLRMSLIAFCFACSFSAGTATAQDLFSTDDGTNPFNASDPAQGAGSIFGGGNSTAPALAGNTGTTTSTAVEKETSPIVLMLRENPPTTPVEMAQGLAWMHSLGRAGEIDRLLGVAAGWSDQMKIELAREAGGAFWIKLRSYASELTEASRTTLQEIQSSPSRQARSPQWINRWADLLASDQPGELQLAQLRLQDAGKDAIVNLLARLTSGQGNVPPQRLAGAIAAFGDEGERALRAAASLGDEAKVSRVLKAIDARRPVGLSSELSAAALGHHVDKSTAKEIASKIDAAYGKTPSPTLIAAHVTQKINNAMHQYNQSRTSAAGTTAAVWRRSADGATVEYAQTEASMKHLAELAHWARVALSLPITPEQASDCKAVLLQEACKRPLTEREVAIGQLTQKGIIAPGELPHVFEHANRLQFHAASLGAIRLIGQSEQEPALAHLDLLSRLLRDSRPAVRYTALTAIANIDPKTPYYGAETALATALEMARISSGPTVLVIGLHTDIRQAAAQQLKDVTGAVPLTANSARTAAMRLRSGQPIEMIFVVDRVQDQSLYQLLQRLRGGRHSKALPIALLTDELTTYEAELASQLPGVVRSVLSRSESQMARVINMLHDELDTDPFDPVDRAGFQDAGQQMLVRITSDRQNYGFYPISDLREELSQFDSSVSGSSQLSLLSGIGTANSQWKLVQMAANLGSSGQDPMAAAASFSTSVERFGVVIKQEDVLRIYELYNAFGPSDASAASALGSILDLIESRSAQGQ